jgi:hypothetical protein
MTEKAEIGFRFIDRLKEIMDLPRGITSIDIHIDCNEIVTFSIKGEIWQSTADKIISVFDDSYFLMKKSEDESGNSEDPFEDVSF